MAYKDKERQREAQKLWARKARKQHIERLRSYKKQHKEKVAKWFRELKATLKCSRCPETHPACLVFHHTNPSDKVASITWMVNRGVAMELVLDEIEKCIVLCANCHAKEHFQQV